MRTFIQTHHLSLIVFAFLILAQNPLFAETKTFECHAQSGECNEGVGGGGGNWEDDDNWSPPGVPDSDDDVIVNCGTVNATCGAITIKSLTMNGGTVKGTENITVTDYFNWTGGWTKGTGKILCPPACNVRLFGPKAKRVGKPVEIEGNATWESDCGAVYFDNDIGGQVVMKGSGNLEIQATGSKLYAHAKTSTNLAGALVGTVPVVLRDNATGILHGSGGLGITGGIGFKTETSTTTWRNCQNTNQSECDGGGSGTPSGGQQDNDAPPSGSPPPADTCDNAGVGSPPVSGGGGSGNGSNGGGGNNSGGSNCNTGLVGENAEEEKSSFAAVQQMGKWVVGPGAQYRAYNVQMDLASGAQLLGVGTVELHSATLNANSGSTFNAGIVKLKNTAILQLDQTGTMTSLEIDNATLRGTASATVSGNLDFKKGYVTGDGDLNVNGQTLVSTTGGKSINRRIKTNGGGSWTGGDLNFVAKGCIETPANTVFLIDATATSRNFRNGNGAVFDVFGHLQLKSGTGQMLNQTAGSGVETHEFVNLAPPGGASGEKSFALPQWTEERESSPSGPRGYRDLGNPGGANCGGTAAAAIPQRGRVHTVNASSGFEFGQNYTFHSGSELTGPGIATIKANGNVTLDVGSTSSMDSVELTTSTSTLTVNAPLNFPKLTITNGNLNYGAAITVGSLKQTGGTVTASSTVTATSFLQTFGTANFNGAATITTFNQSNGTSNFNAAAAIATLNMGETGTPTLGGTGNVSVSGNLLMKRGILSGTGTMVVQGTSTMEFSDVSVYKTLTLNGGGTLNQNITFSPNAAQVGKIIVPAGKMLTLQILPGVTKNYHAFGASEPTVFEVSGTMFMMGNGKFLSNVGNPGIRVLQDGLLKVGYDPDCGGEVTSGGSTGTPVEHGGTFDIAVPAKFSFNKGNHNLTGSVTGLGTFDVSTVGTVNAQNNMTAFNPAKLKVQAGTFNLNKSGFAVDSLHAFGGNMVVNTNGTFNKVLETTSGVIDGTGNFTVNNTFRSDGGTIKGTGTMTVNGQFLMPISGNRSMNKTVITAGGGLISVPSASTHALIFGFSGVTLGKFVVPTGALLEINTSGADLPINTFGASTVFEVAGTLRKTGAFKAYANTSSGTRPSFQTLTGGLMDVQTGELWSCGLDNGTTNAIEHYGDIDIKPGAKFRLLLGHANFNTGTVGGGGTFRFENSAFNVNILGTMTAFSPAFVEINGGNVNLNKDLDGADVNMAISNANGKLNVLTDCSIGNLTHTYMNVEGTGNLTVQGNYTWAGGTIDGTGLMNVQGTTSITATTTCRKRLTLGGGGTWSGGTINFNQATGNGPFGTVSIPGGQLLTISNAVSYASVSGVAGVCFDVLGTLRKTGSNTVSVNDFNGAINFGAATRVGAGGLLDIQGGEFQTYGGKYLGSTLQQNGDISIAPGATLRLRHGNHDFLGGNLTGSGSLAVESTSADPDSIFFRNTMAGFSPGSLSLGAGAMRVFSEKTFSNNAINIANGSSTLHLAQPVTTGSFSQAGNTLDGPGNLNVTGDFSFSFGNLKGGSSVTVGGASTLGNGNLERHLTLNGGGTWGGTMTFSNPNTAQPLPGKITVAAGQTLTVNQTANSTFTVAQPGGAVIEVAGTFEKSNTAFQVYLNGPGGIRTLPSGTIRVQNGLLYTGGPTATPIQQEGTIDLVNAGSTLRISSGVTQFNATSIISGSGKWKTVFPGSHTIQPNFQIKPGNSPGILTIDSLSTTELDFSSNPVLSIEIAGNGGAGAVNGHDQLVVGKPVTFGGTLDVTLLGGFLPNPGDAYVLMSYLSHTGTFGTVNLPINPAAWQLNYGATSLTLTLLSSLPVELLDFSGTFEGEKAVLNWATASESNSAWHHVERSADGYTWEAIGKVAAAGNSTERQDYAFDDLAPLPLGYYRLRMEDLDGSAEYSPVIALRREGGNFQLESVFPNPAAEALTLRFFAQRESDAHLKIWDAMGRLIRSERFETGSGFFDKTLMVSDMASGVYFLEVEIAGAREWRRWLKD